MLLGLLTGNFEEGARIKLEHFDLWRYFQCGAFGDDSADRNDLVPFAVERARQCGLDDIEPSRIVVVGDTPHDIACARAVGAVPVGVATGGFTSEQLRESGADIVFEHLADPARFLQLIEDRIRITEVNGARWPSRSSKPVAAHVHVGGLGSTPRRFRQPSLMRPHAEARQLANANPTERSDC